MLLSMNNYINLTKPCVYSKQCAIYRQSYRHKYVSHLILWYAYKPKIKVTKILHFVINEKVSWKKSHSSTLITRQDEITRNTSKCSQPTKGIAFTFMFTWKSIANANCTNKFQVFPFNCMYVPNIFAPTF